MNEEIRRKKIVGVENTERDDLHQFDLLKKMEEEGHLIWCINLAELGECIKKAEKTNFKKYTKPENNLAKEITRLLA